MNKRHLSIPVTLSALALALTACGGGGESGPSESPSASASATETASASPSPSRTDSPSPSASDAGGLITIPGLEDEEGSPSPSASASATNEPESVPVPEVTEDPATAPVAPAPSTGYTVQDHINAGGGCFSDYFPLGEPAPEALEEIQAYCATQDPADHVDWEATAELEEAMSRPIPEGGTVDSWPEHWTQADIDNYVETGVEPPSEWVQGQIEWANMTPEEQAAEREKNIAEAEARGSNY